MGQVGEGQSIYQQLLHCPQGNPTDGLRAHQHDKLKGLDVQYLAQRLKLAVRYSAIRPFPYRYPAKLILVIEGLDC